MALQFPKEVILEYITKHITDDYDDRYEPWININSVFASDNQYKLGFNPDENRVFDFKLGQGWTIPGFITEYDDSCFSEVKAQELLLRILMRQKKNGLKLTFGSTKPKNNSPIDLPPLKTVYPETKSLLDKNVLDNKLGMRAIKFLASKNLGFEHVKKFNLQYVDDFNCWHCHGTGEVKDENCHICDKSSGRNPYYGFLIIPTFEKGNLVYFQARNTDRESDFRYRNPPVPRIQTVYFYDLLKDNDRIFITEGSIDAMSLINYSATCVMGNKLSDPQAQKILAKNPIEIIFIPDWDTNPETRKRIFKSLDKNISKIKYYSQNKSMKIGVYEWYVKYKNKLINGKKDLNDLGLTVIEEELINYDYAKIK